MIDQERMYFVEERNLEFGIDETHKKNKAGDLLTYDEAIATADSILSRYEIRAERNGARKKFCESLNVIVVAEIDKNCRFLDANRNMCKITGRLVDDYAVPKAGFVSDSGHEQNIFIPLHEARCEGGNPYLCRFRENQVNGRYNNLVSSLITCIQDQFLDDQVHISKLQKI